MNNELLYNAVLAGISGSTQNLRQGFSKAADYTGYADRATVLAVAVDALVAPAAITQSEAQLMGQIVSGIDLHRCFIGGTPVYSSIAADIVTMWTEFRTRISSTASLALVLEFDTIAALRLSMVNFPLVYVRRYAGVGSEGGGGWFELMSGDVTADNGVTYFVNAAGGRYFRTAAKGKTVLNVRWGGALVDDAANDVAAIQAVLNVAGRGSSVLIEGGIARINTHLTLPDYVSIEGNEGSGIRLTIHAENGIQPGNHCRISRLTILGDGGGGGVDFTKQTGILVTNAEGVNIDSCTISGWESAGIRTANCRDYRITNNLLYANPYLAFPDSGDILLYSAGGIGGRRSIISGNFCFSNNSQGIYISALGADEDLVVDSNVCVTLDPVTCVDGGTWTEIANGGIRRHAILAQYGSSVGSTPRCIISNNLCRNTQWTGVYCPSAAHGVVIITGNICSRNGFFNGELCGGIWVRQSGGEIITGNFVDEYQGNLAGLAPGAISIEGGVPVSTVPTILANNTIRNSLGHGLSISGNCPRKVKVSGNVFEGTAGHDIDLTGSATAGTGGHEITGNTFTRANTAYSCIQLIACTNVLGIHVRNNFFYGVDNVTNVATNAGIDTANSTLATLHISNNLFETFRHGIYFANYLAGRNPSIDITRNIFSNCFNACNLSATDNNGTVPITDCIFNNCTNKSIGSLGGNAGYPCTKEGDRLIIETVNASPPFGTWAVGDRTHYTAPVSGGYIGSVCTAAGAPGTWKGFGLIA